MQNGVKLLLIILVIALLVLGWQLSMSRKNNQLLQSQLVEQSLDLQKKCSAQAEHLFKSSHPNDDGLDRYENHYNGKLNKCFVSYEIRSFSNDKSFLTMTLEDAYEHKVYAEFLTTNEGDTGICWFFPGTDQKERCKSRSEYNNFLQNYMN